MCKSTTDPLNQVISTDLINSYWLRLSFVVIEHIIVIHITQYLRLSSNNHYNCRLYDIVRKYEMVRYDKE